MTKQKEFENAVDEYNTAKMTELLKCSNIDPADFQNYAIGIACRLGDLKLVKLLLKDSRVDPSDNHNWAINEADLWDFDYVVLLLWNDKRVKNTLRKDYNMLYNKLILQDIQNKVEQF